MNVLKKKKKTLIFKSYKKIKSLTPLAYLGPNVI